MGALLGRKALDAAIEKAEERRERQPSRPITLPRVYFLERPMPAWWDEKILKRQKEVRTMGAAQYLPDTEKRIKEMAASGSSLNAIAAEIGKTRDATRVWMRRHAVDLRPQGPSVTTADEAIL